MSSEDDVPKWLQECSRQIIEHVNADHRKTLAASLNALYEIQDKEAKMVKLEVHGYHIQSKKTYSLYDSLERVILAKNTAWN